MSRGLKIFFIVFILGIFSLVLWLKSKNKIRQNNYETTQVAIASIIKNRFISGSILPSKEINLIPQLSGIIEEIYVETGDKVEKGTPIAKIKLIASPESVERAEKTLKIAQLMFELNTKDFHRNKTLIEKDIIPKSEFEKIENKWILSKEELISAKKHLQIVQGGYAQGKENISNIVTSTIKGTVLKLPVEIGASVTGRNTFNSGSTIALIADMNQLIFKGQVNEKDLFFLQEGMGFNVSVSALNDRQFKTILTTISPKAIKENGIVKFDFEGEIIATQLDSLPTRSGYSGIAEIILEKADDIITIEEKNIIFKNDSIFVEIVVDDKIEKQHIVTGISDGIIIEIKRGLNKTDKIKIQE